MFRVISVMYITDNSNNDRDSWSHRLYVYLPPFCSVGLPWKEIDPRFPGERGEDSGINS